MLHTQWAIQAGYDGEHEDYLGECAELLDPCPCGGRWTAEDGYGRDVDYIVYRCECGEIKYQFVGKY